MTSLGKKVRSGVSAVGGRGCAIAVGALIALTFLCGIGIDEAKAASQGCTSVNSGSWLLSASNNGQASQEGDFANGDFLTFQFEGNGIFEFGDSLSGGGSGEGDGSENNPKFSSGYGTGSLTLNANGGEIDVESASCTPAPLPTVTSVSPVSGPTTGFNHVVVTGTGFSGQGTDIVSFGGIGSCCIESFSGTTQITVDSTGGTGTVDVTVTNNAGTSAINPADKYTFVLPLTSDFNNDGVSDILWGDASGDVAMWLMKGGQNAGQILSAATLGNVGTSWHVVGTRDLDGDGKDDILWQDGSGNVGIWLMNGTTVSSTVGLGNVGAQWQVAGTGYFYARPTGDILWRNTSTGDLWLWPMESAPDAGTIVPGEAVDFGNISPDWQVVGTGDFNADGTTDILWRNSSTGDLAIWFMENNLGTPQVESTIDLGTVAADWIVAGTGDFNGDDTSDILWRNTASGELAVWFMSNGQLSSSADIAAVSLNWSVVAVGDYNGDGKSDILWKDGSGDLGVWLMNGATPSSEIGLGNVGTSWQVLSVSSEN